jgi:hypothetical protein
VKPIFFDAELPDEPGDIIMAVWKQIALHKNNPAELTALNAELEQLAAEAVQLTDVALVTLLRSTFPWRKWLSAWTVLLRAAKFTLEARHGQEQAALLLRGLLTAENSV